MNFTPKDQIILLAGLLPDEVQRQHIWSLPELRSRLARMNAIGLIQSGSLSQPAGVDAARRIHHIVLDDLLAEHLPDRAGAAALVGSKPTSGAARGETK